MSEFLFVVIVAFFLTLAVILLTFIFKRLWIFIYRKIKYTLKKHLVIGKIR